jgi:hypothetical protein
MNQDRAVIQAELVTINHNYKRRKYGPNETIMSGFRQYLSHNFAPHPFYSLNTTKDVSRVSINISENMWDFPEDGASRGERTVGNSGWTY